MTPKALGVPDFRAKSSISFENFSNISPKQKRDSAGIVIIYHSKNSKPKILKFIKDNNIRTKYFDTTNHKEKCYELMIPFTKYSSIEEETNGKVKDLHIGEEGHRELTKTLISLIEKSLNKPSPRKIMNVPNNYPKEKQKFI